MRRRRDAPARSHTWPDLEKSNVDHGVQPVPQLRLSFDQLVDAGSMAEAKSRGWVRMEGKDYVMQDGDVVEFRFNV